VPTGEHKNLPRVVIESIIVQTMRLRQDQPSVTQSQTRSRKRKSPPSADALQPVPPPPPPATTMQHTLPPAHTLVPPPHLPGHVMPPPGYQYPSGEFSSAGLPPPHSLGHPPSAEGVQDQRPQSQASNGAANTASSGATRTLSQSKRAEQNRKAQRAFRERRDQCVLSLNTIFFFHRMLSDMRIFTPLGTLKH
jgi:hypothetical protein